MLRKPPLRPLAILWSRDLSVREVARDEADTQRIPPGGTPGYTVYTLRAGARLTDGLRVFAAVENVTDVDYRIHGSGQNEAGTNVILGADWTF